MSSKNTMSAYVRSENRAWWEKIIDGIFDLIGYLLVVSGSFFFLGMSFVIGLPSFVNALENVENGDSVSFLQAMSLGGAVTAFVIGLDLAKRLTFGSSRD